MARIVNDNDDVVVDREAPVTHYDRGAGRGTTMLTWLALALAVLALVLAWMAYDRTGGDLDTRIQRGVDNAMQSTRDAADTTEDAIDAGPDGVDEDDTDVVQPTNP